MRRLFIACVLVASAASCAKGHDAPAVTSRRDSGHEDAATDARVDAADSGSVDGSMGDSSAPDTGATCPTGQAFCDGACRDVSVDPGHCGDCATSCAAGSVCAAGSCELSCPGGTTGCAGGCVDTSTDEANCGACGTICAAGQACMAGSCVSVCAPGEVYCTDHCVAPMGDPDNCGGCGLRCVRMHGSAACVAGSCRLDACDPGFADCDGNDANGCELSVSCSAGASCTTSCGTTGSRDCSDACSPSCAPPAESCDLMDDDCDGRCDDLMGCRAGVYRSWDPTLPGGHGGHIYTLDLAVAQQPPDRMIERENFFYVYSSDPGGLVPLYRCRLSSTSATNFLATGSACEGAGVPVETLGYIARSATCGAVPLYRLYNATTGDHFYTTSAAERDGAISTFGYILESTAGYVWTAPGG